MFGIFSSETLWHGLLLCIFAVISSFACMIWVGLNAAPLGAASAIGPDGVALLVGLVLFTLVATWIIALLVKPAAARVLL